jgi:hypothetical protein
MARKIDNATAKALILDANPDEIFSVTFIKRTTGERRKMTCRRGVDAYVKGTGIRPGHVGDQNLITVFDVQQCKDAIKAFREQVGREPTDAEKHEIGRECYRNINLETIIDLKVGGSSYKVNDFPLRTYTYYWRESGVGLNRSVRGRTRGEADMVFKREQRIDRLPRGLSVKEPK